MKLIDYYQQEIRYFLDEAQRFAVQYPEQAKALNLEEVKERDPYVERLIEGFAFLSGNINKRLNDDFSDLAQDLIEVLWPHYLCPLPAALIVQFTPIPGRLKGIRKVEAGGVIDSEPVSTGLPCRFTTTAPVYLRPIEIREAAMVGRRDGRSALRIVLCPSKGVEWGNMGSDPVRFYLHGDPGFAFSLYYMLLQDTENISVRSVISGEEREVDLSPERIKATAFSQENDSPLLPYPVNSFPGFRLLEEYFFFPEKFRFIDLDIMDHVKNADDESEVRIDFLLSGRNEWRINPNASAFRLHCSPAVNLYPKAAEPIRLEDAVPYNQIIADQVHLDHHVPHHLHRVEGIRLESAQRHVYDSFLSYRHESETSHGASYYHLKRQTGVDGRPEMLLGINRPDGLGSEVLSIDLMCSNDRVVREVKLGDVRYPDESIPDSVRVANLTVPRTPVRPSLEGREMWTLIHHLSLNYLSLDNPVRLRALLSLYDREHSRANLRRLEGIEAVSIRPSEILFKGCPLRGIDMDITIRENHFTGQGDLLMFSYVMSRVMAMYVSINSFCNLTIREVNTEKVYKWPRIKGSKANL